MRLPATARCAQVPFSPTFHRASSLHSAASALNAISSPSDVSTSTAVTEADHAGAGEADDLLRAAGRADQRRGVAAAVVQCLPEVLAGNAVEPGERAGLLAADGDDDGVPVHERGRGHAARREPGVGVE